MKGSLSSGHSIMASILTSLFYSVNIEAIGIFSNFERQFMGHDWRCVGDFFSVVIDEIIQKVFERHFIFNEVFLRNLFEDESKSGDDEQKRIFSC